MKSQSRNAAIQNAIGRFDDGSFQTELAALVAHRSESQRTNNAAALHGYLHEALAPRFTSAGFDVAVHNNPDPRGGPFLTARRIESPGAQTVLIYGHGDVVLGQDGAWSGGRDPFILSDEGPRLYGRGTADNKAQHLINLMALEAVLSARGHLGFNVIWLIEMSEETGSPGLSSFIEQNQEVLAADVLIASDGPRLQENVPTIFLGARGSMNFELTVNLRDGAHHSGNWGGLLSDPAQRLAHALASIADARGQILVPEWRPDSLSDELKVELDALPMKQEGTGEGPEVSKDWGEIGLGAGSRAFGWNSFAILAMESGIPESPMNAISGLATATCQLRFVVGTNEDGILGALRRHLDDQGFKDVEITGDINGRFKATRHTQDHPWVSFVEQSLTETAGVAPHVLLNLAGSLPNEVFTDILGLPTVWVPHSYRGCNQHAPDEHVLKSVCREALGLMAGLWWDIGCQTKNRSS